MQPTRKIRVEGGQLQVQERREWVLNFWISVENPSNTSESLGQVVKRGGDFKQCDQTGLLNTFGYACCCFFFNMSSLLLFYSIFYFSYFSKPNPLKPICLASLMMTTLQMCNTMLNLILCLRHQKLTATFFFFFVKPSHFNLPSSQWTGNRVESLQIMRYFRPCTTNLFFLSICHLNGKQHNNLM